TPILKQSKAEPAADLCNKKRPRFVDMLRSADHTFGALRWNMKAASHSKSSIAGYTRFATFAWLITVLTFAVILWGAYVRASRSGDGCGAHWPLCNGTTALPQATEVKTLIEFAHRATSGVAFLLIVVLFVWAFRLFPRGHAVRAGAALSTVFIVTESLIGAG